MRTLGELIYTPERASGEVASKVKSHAPRIEAPSTVKAGQPFELRVTVGPHPNAPGHSIRWIDVYVQEESRPFNPVHVARVELTSTYAEPNVSLTLSLKRSSIVHVVAYCNVHGVWEGVKEVEVTG